MGNGEMAVRCLKVALQHAPVKYRVSVRVEGEECEGGGCVGCEDQDQMVWKCTPAKYCACGVKWVSISVRVGLRHKG